MTKAKNIDFYHNLIVANILYTYVRSI